MFGFTPVAAAPIADDGVANQVTFAVNNIVTGAPTVANVTFTGVQSLTATSIVTGAAVVSSLSLIHI